MRDALKRILVTGGAGFIGSHTVDLLLKKNKEVFVLDNLSSGKKENLKPHPHLHFIEGDILDYYLVKELVAKSDAILHLAAIVSVQETINNPIYSFQANVQGQLHILQAIHESKRPIRLVYASSAAVYGPNQMLPCQDDLPLSTELLLSPYALQKMNNEEYGRLYAELYHINSQALRYFNVYGRGQDPQSPYAGVISRFINAYTADKELIIHGDGKQSRDFIHVNDVARANYLALTSQSSEALNIATGYPQTLLQLIACIEEVGGKLAKRSYTKPRTGDIPHSYANPLLAKQLLNFEATISLQEGIKKLLVER